MSPRLSALCLALLFTACPKPPPPTSATLQGPDFSVLVESKPFSLTIRDAAGVTRLATKTGPRFTYDARTYEAQFVPGWDGLRSNERAWTEVTDANLVASTSTTATLEFGEGDQKVTVTIGLEGHSVKYTQAIADTRRFNKADIGFKLEPDEHFFGMGQRTASVDHRGLSLYSWAEEGGLGGGENTPLSANNPYPNGPSMTYFPVPLFHSTRGVSTLVDTTYRSEVDFGAKQSDQLRVIVDTSSLALVFFVRDQPLDALDDYTQLTGRPLIPPPWAFGPRRRININRQIEGKLEWALMRERNLPLTGIDDALHVLPSGSQVGREAEVRAWTTELHANGFKVQDYNNPYLSASAPNSMADYEYGASRGFFETAPDGGPATTFFLSGGPQTISAIDLTNPEAAAWFESLLQRSFDLGYDGWMHDFGEYVARSSRFHDGRKGDEVHNEYPVLSAKAGYEIAMKVKGGDALVFSRSGYTGSQKWVFATWGGDPEASFDETIGLPAMLRGGLNLSLVSVPYWSTDIGGYKCLTDAPHDKEMLVRWYFMSVLSPMMHDQDACSNPVAGNEVKARLWDDLETQDAWRQAAGLHTRLAPYFRALALEAHARGTPITRHPFLVFPKEPEAWKVEDSFFVGQGIYGAPVVRRGLTTRRVWLPPGRYVEWTDRTVHTGPAFVEVPAPLMRLPMFLVENQLVPLLDARVQTLAPATLDVATEQKFADVLDVIAVVGPNGTASFTLTDGTVLTAKRLASNVGNPGTLATFSGADCARCGDVDGKRVRITGALGTNSVEQLGDVEVQVTGTVSRRVRWEVITLP
ncbi:MAG TPA: TIM-barrel domain-containing protein [Archangium sp.]